MDTFDYIIDEFDLSIGVEERDGEEGIVLEDKRNVWEVIHLYNDDHLNSPITEIGYQIDGKDARTDDGDEDQSPSAVLTVSYRNHVSNWSAIP